MGFEIGIDTLWSLAGLSSSPSSATCGAVERCKSGWLIPPSSVTVVKVLENLVKCALGVCERRPRPRCLGRLQLTRKRAPIASAPHKKANPPESKP